MPKTDRFLDELTCGDVERLLELLRQTGRPFRIKFYRSGALKRITIYERWK